jgi:AsmA-like C-terminal region
MRLQTTFSATVDGINGDTLLHPVNAQFGHTTVVAQGEIIGDQGVRGKTIELDASVQDGDIADVLRLGVKSRPPPMNGRVRFQAKIRIPPGEGDIPHRLELNDRFEIAGGRFTNPTLEQKLSTISERTRGQTDGHGQSAAASDFRGNFALRNGLMTLTGFSFHIPGATVRLDGTYGLESEQLNFRGTVTTEVRLSQMTTGLKSKLLRVVDPIFSRNRTGALIPIHIGGTRTAPSFGLDIKR